MLEKVKAIEQYYLWIPSISSATVIAEISNNTSVVSLEFLYSSKIKFVLVWSYSQDLKGYFVILRAADSKLILKNFVAIFTIKVDDSNDDLRTVIHLYTVCAKSNYFANLINTQLCMNICKSLSNLPSFLLYVLT